ncbi:hypothetical protein F5H01DRAFT_360824 [Linnemannia elongata]|nr:hypothetical protein F5H01DRAFT_360824 [Linnemannia elongata]
MTRQGIKSPSHPHGHTQDGQQKVDAQGPTTAASPNTSTTTILDSQEQLETTTATLDALAINSNSPTSAASQRSNKLHQRIPSEIIIAFGALLDGPSLVTCFQVCHQWLHVLQPLAWVMITRRQWYLDSFPLKAWTKLAPPFYMDDEAKANQIFTDFCNTRSVEWYDVSAVRHGGWRGPEYAPSYQSEINLSKLSIIFRSMIRLNRLNLTITSHRLYHNSVLDVLKVSNLPHLRYLRLFMSFNFSPLSIEELFPLFSRLDEIIIRGNWYRELDPLRRRFPTNAPWRLKRFTIDHVQIQFFLKHCPSLEEMTFRRPMVKWSRRGGGYRERMLQQLLDMPRFKAITVSGIGGTDPVEYRTEEVMGLKALWKKTIVAKTEDGERIEMVGEREVTIQDIVAHVVSND